jgi:hypothetical protein
MVPPMDASTMAAVVKWHLRVVAMLIVHQRVRIKILRQGMNLRGTVPCSPVVIADLVTVLMAIAFGRDHPSIMERALMSSGAWRNSGTNLWAQLRHSGMKWS